MQHSDLDADGDETDDDDGGEERQGRGSALIMASFETSCSSSDDDDDDEGIWTSSVPLTPRYRRPLLGIVVLIAVGAAGIVTTSRTTERLTVDDAERENILAKSIVASSALEYTDDGKITWATRGMLTDKSSLLDPLIDEWRQGRTIDPEALGIQAPTPETLQNCSCLTVLPDVWATSHDKPSSSCCDRVFIRGHKMGVQLTALLFRSFDFHNRYKPLNAEHWIESNDLRVAVVLRNIYQALVSGYLYHKQGRECYTDPNGGRLIDKHTRKPRIGKTDYLNYTTFIDAANPPVANNLCQYLMDQPVQSGMRAYIDYVFRGDYYASSLLVWRALSQQVDWVAERTQVTCYESLVEHRTDALHDLLQFYYPSGIPQSAQVRARDASHLTMLSSTTTTTKHGTIYTGPHSTTHDAQVRESLVQVIKELDVEFYDGQIAFVDTMIPCGK